MSSPGTLFAAVCQGNSVTINCLPHTANTANGSVIQTLLQIAIGVVAAMSLLFIVIGGMRYVFSQGDSGAVSKAKGTIVFAIVGLVVAIFAQVIVVFVVKRVAS